MGKHILIGVLVALLLAGAFYMNADKKEEETVPIQQETKQTNEDAEPVQTQEDRPQIQEKGSVAKDFELKTLSGDKLQLHTDDGKPTLVNFWASWCPPCKKEMPDIQKAYEKYGKEVNFFMVDLTFNDSLDKMTEYIEENNFTFPVLLDETGDVTMDYQVAVVPTTFIVDENHVITHKIMGPMTMQQIETIMNEITSS